MAQAYRLRVVTTEHEIFDGPVIYTHVSGADGDMGVLAHHMPIVTPLKIAPVDVELPEGETLHFAVHAGFLEVDPEGAVILSETAERKEDIDVDRARRALERAEASFSHAEDEEARIRAMAARERARTRLRVAGALTMTA